MLINGLGAFATGITVIVVLVAKFVEGAWITVLLIPGLLLAMRLVRRHYHAVFLEVRSKTPLELTDMVAGLAAPELVVLPSPFRLVLAPIVDYVLEAERANPGQQIAVLVPELVERHWYHHLFHNKRASVLKALLLLRGNQRIIVINVPWYLDA